MRARIVVVEDEPDLRDAVAEYLGANGYDVTPAADAAADARSLLETQSFHLAILDIAMPGEDGLSLGRWLRSKMPIGVIFATAAGTAIDRIVGLELGADDYIVKPYELREVLARSAACCAACRSRANPGEPSAEPEAPAAASWLRRLPGRSRRQAGYRRRRRGHRHGQERVRRAGSFPDARQPAFDARGDLRGDRFCRRPENRRAPIDIRIMRLRKKIEADPANPKFLRTVRGEGYIFSLPTAEA